MRHVGCAMLCLMVCGGVAHAQEQSAQAPKAFVLEGESAIWTISVKADKTGDFEQVMRRLHEGLMKSAKPERHQQAAGWKLLKVGKALPDGNMAYVHVISPVVPNADYTILQILYDEFPSEKQALYDLYRGAFAANLSLATGSVVVDMTKTN